MPRPPSKSPLPKSFRFPVDFWEEWLAFVDTNFSRTEPMVRIVQAAMTEYMERHAKNEKKESRRI